LIELNKLQKYGTAKPLTLIFRQN